MNSQYKIELSVGLFVLVALLCVGYLTVQLGQMRLIGDGHYVLQARFSSVTGLNEGNEVLIAGVPVGRVKNIRLDADDFAATVKLSIRDDIKLSDDSIASIKTSGLIGDKYISISPGGSGFYLKPGDTIIDTQPPMDIEELISKYVFGDV